MPSLTELSGTGAQGTDSLATVTLSSKAPHLLSAASVLVLAASNSSMFSSLISNPALSEAATRIVNRPISSLKGALIRSRQATVEVRTTPVSRESTGSRKKADTASNSIPAMAMRRGLAMAVHPRREPAMDNPLRSERAMAVKLKSVLGTVVKVTSALGTAANRTTYRFMEDARQKAGKKATVTAEMTMTPTAVADRMMSLHTARAADMGPVRTTNLATARATRVAMVVRRNRRLMAADTNRSPVSRVATVLGQSILTITETDTFLTSPSHSTK